jgi:hypothetical protein
MLRLITVQLEVNGERWVPECPIARQTEFARVVTPEEEVFVTYRAFATRALQYRANVPDSNILVALDGFVLLPDDEKEESLIAAHGSRASLKEI